MKKIKEETPKVATEQVAEVQKTILPTKVLMVTLEYLATKPFNEVYELVSAIQSQSEPVK